MPECRGSPKIPSVPETILQLLLVDPSQGSFIQISEQHVSVSARAHPANFEGHKVVIARRVVPLEEAFAAPINRN